MMNTRYATLSRRFWNNLLNTSLACCSLLTLSLPSLAQTGIAHTWGLNSNGQLGDGTQIQENLPINVPGLNAVVSLAGGGLHTLAARADGTVFAWGANSHGQLGDFSTVERHSPVQLGSFGGNFAPRAVQVACGDNHSIVLTANGTVWTSGRNDAGQLGDGTTTERNNFDPPFSSPMLSNIVQISACLDGGIALASDGTVWTWGFNGNGQLGIGSSVSFSTKPVQVKSLFSIIQVAGSRNHCMALRADGTVFAWGLNDRGQLGDGTTSFHSSPVQVKGLANVTQIAGGGLHSLALTSSGSVFAWGDNENGELGLGDTNNRLLPAQVPFAVPVVQIAEGLFHSMALCQDGTLMSWGGDSFGQLGDGANTNQLSPVPVSDLVGQTVIAGGVLHSLSAQAALLSSQIDLSNLTVPYGTHKGPVVSLTLAGTGMPLVGKPVAFLLNQKVIQVDVTRADGSTVLDLASLPALTPGAYTLTALFQGTGAFQTTSATVTLNVIKDNTFLTTSTVSGTTGQTVKISTILERNNDATVPFGGMLTFSIGNQVLGSALTNVNGFASINFTIEDSRPVGNYAVTIRYAGDSNRKGCSANLNLIVEKSQVRVTMTKANATAHHDFYLNAKIVRSTTNQPLAGRTLHFSINAVHVGDAVTNSQGNATCHVPAALSRPGDYNIFATFDGDSQYLSGTGESVLNVN